MFPGSIPTISKKIRILSALKYFRNRYDVRWRHDLLSFSIASAQISHII